MVSLSVPTASRCVVEPADTSEWLDVLSAEPTAGVTQTPAWRDLVCAPGRFRDASRLYRFPDGRRVVLPLARRRGLPAAGIGSWPFDWGIGGPLADGPVGRDQVAAVYADLLSQPALSVTVRMNPLVDPAWPVFVAGFVTSERTTHVLDLSDGFDSVWRTSFRSSVRRAVGKAERSRLEVEVDRTGRFVPEFTFLYELSVRRWAKAQNEPLISARWRSRRANPPEKFQAVARALGTRCAIWLARLDGEPAAAIVVLSHGTQAKYWRGAMDASLAAPVRANDLLHRLAIEDACRSGCVKYHMGDSRPGSGLARFKEGFGAEPLVSRTHRAERLPLTGARAGARRLVKSVIGFRDA